jgi:putative inorganic carbon (HCO3(-)) transporter
MLRTIFVFGIVLIGVVYAFQGPFNILLFYLWYAYFRPEYWVWDPALVSSLNLSLVIGVVLLVSSLSALRSFRWSRQATLLVLFFLQSGISLLASEHFDWSLLWWTDFAKALIVSFLIAALVTDAKRYRLALMVIAYSLGLEAAKQGWAQMVLNTGATNNNPNPMLGDNNGVAAGMMMLIPLFIALAQTAKTFWERWLHRFFVVGVLYRGISTYSRGGFLAAVAVGLVLLWYSPRKIRAVLFVAALGWIVVAAMPQSFWDRMNTMTVSAESRDAVSEGRLSMWSVAVHMADARPLTGVGFNGFERSFSDYDTTRGAFGENRAVHSAWFGVLADMGYPGLVLFVLIVAGALHSSFRLSWRTRRHPAARDLRAYSSAMFASLVAYVVAMTFLSGQYLEMFWHLVGLSMALDAIRAGATSPVSVPAWQAPPAAQPMVVAGYGPVVR